jgi:uncharacterized protein YcbK (DUF882 family)
MDRRQFLKAAGISALGMLLPTGAWAGMEDLWERPRLLHLKRSTTGEEFRATVWQDGRWDETAYEKANHLLRDVQADKVISMDRGLLLILFGMQEWARELGYDRPIIVNSGYRTEQTNHRLLEQGAARNSMHIQGRAADIHLPGMNTDTLYRMAYWLQGGGAGFYPSKGFVHVDTGRKRIWKG